MKEFENQKGKCILLKMVSGIHENKTYLGEIDGLIGDGDHGMNMNKGFTVFEERFADTEISFTNGLDELGMILLNEIGGSMGPIYGTFLAEKGAGLDVITLPDFTAMLEAAQTELYEIIEARVGDKTLVDTLTPAVESLKDSVVSSVGFRQALERMKSCAEAGKNSTKGLIAKYGRSSRLGERSKGVLDAGAVSCYIILTEMADGIAELLLNE